MIKTHKPRGHIWSHASVFQQTEEYRNIKYEECAVPSSKILVRDADGGLSVNERAAKRKKIESLADDFLNGVPLLISSARPCPESLKSTIVWNKKSSSEPKFSLSKIDLSGDSYSDSEEWEDQESQAEILERLRCRRQTARPDIDNAGAKLLRSTGEETVQLVQAQASCRAVRHPRVTKIASGSSEDASKQAAALRARRLRGANSDIPLVPDSLPLRCQVVQPELEAPGEPAYDGHDGDQHRRTSQWLSRRKSRFSFAGYDSLDDSIDVLQTSGADASSVALPRNLKNGVDLESIPASRKIRRNSTDANAHDQPFNVQAISDQQSVQQASYHTAPEESEIGPESFATQSSSVNDENDANVSAISTGDHVPYSSRHEADTSSRGERTLTESNYTPQQNPSSRITRSASSRQVPNTANPSLLPDQTHRTRVVRSEPKQATYVAAQTSQQGSTPLLYRKGRLRSRQASVENEPAATDVQQKVRTGDDCIDMVETRSEEQDSACEVRAAPPVSNTSLEHGSSGTPNLNMALFDQHLNSVLPSNPDFKKRSSAVKKAIRRELRNSGAEITRCASELPTSSQVEEPLNPIASPTEDAELVESLQEKWAGTQFLLDQAQRNLVISPEKQGTSSHAVNQDTPQNSRAMTREDDATREPLKQLSQEPMPSTQQLLGNFEGWSTIKKPRVAYRNSLLPTPTARAKNTWTPVNSTIASLSTSGLGNTSDGAERRRSSLRFSIPNELSHHDTSVDEESAQVQSSRSKRSSANVATPISIMKSSKEPQTSPQQTLATPKPVPSAQSTDEESTSQSFTSAPLLSSFQAGQAPPTLLRDTSNLSDTIGELTKDVLDMEDLGGVLSQVG